MEDFLIHNFSIDDESSIPFELIRLTKEGSYDTSVPHRHNYYEVFIFEKGGGQHTIDFKSFAIQDRSIHFVSPGQVHNVVRKEDSKGFVMLFSRSFYSNNHQQLKQFRFLNNNSTEPILNLSTKEFETLNRLVKNIKGEQKSSDLMANKLIQSHLNTFLLHCKRYFKEEGEEKRLSNDSLTFRFRQLIEEDYLSNHAVAEYSEKMNCSEKQLSSSTNKELGMTPKELIYERIILEAKRLVLYTDYSFQEIAYFLNYTDASHFAKFFKAKTGDSPGSYRERRKSTGKG